MDNTSTNCGNETPYCKKCGYATNYCICCHDQEDFLEEPKKAPPVIKPIKQHIPVTPIQRKFLPRGGRR
jgi:hypothetical protein